MTEPTANPHTALTAKRLAITAAAAVLLAVILLPADGPISNWARGLNPGGDIGRELGVLQQFGGATSVIIVLLVMIALDPTRVRRMLDWVLAAIATSLSVLIIKVLTGRPRPMYGDPLQFNGPFGQYIDPTRLHDDGTPHIVGPAFGFDGENLWSMPSSHTSGAFVLAVFLACMYPRLKPMAFGFASLVGGCRIIFGAHYLTDVLVGGLIGWAIASYIIPRGLGVRALDAIWITWIDPKATPAWKGGSHDTAAHTD